MPHGELFFRRKVLVGDVAQDGAWEDVFDKYGISFTDASLSRLATPAPNKEAIENASRLQHGKRVVRSPKYARKDERTVSLEMHLTAPTRTEFWRRYLAFCQRYLDAGFFDIAHKDFTYTDADGNTVPYIFRMTYQSCEEFTEFMQQLARYTLTLNEPDPSNRGAESRRELAYILWTNTENIDATGEAAMPEKLQVKVVRQDGSFLTEMEAMPAMYGMEMYQDGVKVAEFSDEGDINGWFDTLRTGISTAFLKDTDTEVMSLGFVLRSRTSEAIYDSVTINVIRGEE